MFMLTAYLLDKVCVCQQLHNDYRKNCDCLDEINRQLSSPVIDDLHRMDLGLLHDTYVDLCDDSKERWICLYSAIVRAPLIVISAPFNTNLVTGKGIVNDNS